MGIRPFLWRSVAFLGLLVGVGGCEDRLRPLFGGVGNGIGPLSLVTTPAELATVTRGVSFTVGVRIEDEDGIDSVWVVPSDTLMASLVFSGSGQDVVLASYSPTVSHSYLSDTLVISVHGIDLLGDTGVVYTRHLLVQ
jgi:hypothetical protein